MNIGRKKYYKYRNTIDKDYNDYLIIKEVFEEGKRMYGYRRIKKVLLIKYCWIVNHKKILIIKNKYGLQVRYKDIFKPNYVKRANKGNLLNKNFKANENWKQILLI